MTNCNNDCEVPHRIEEKMKKAIAAQKTLRVPKRSAIQPLAGMKMAKAIMYEVTPVLSRTTSVPKLSAMAGRAVFTAVVSRNCMKNAIATTNDTVMGRFEEVVCVILPAK